jgi:DNA-binding NtrC family response regulator
MADGGRSNAAAPGAGDQVLVLNHDPVSSRWFDQTLRAQGHRVTIAWDSETALMIYQLERDSIAAVIINMTMPNGEGEATLQALLDIDRYAKVIVFGTEPGFDLRGTVAAIPMPLDNRSVELAIHMAGARKRPSIRPPAR